MAYGGIRAVIAGKRQGRNGAQVIDIHAPKCDYTVFSDILSAKVQRLLHKSALVSSRIFQRSVKVGAETGVRTRIYINIQLFCHVGLDGSTGGKTGGAVAGGSEGDIHILIRRQIDNGRIPVSYNPGLFHGAVGDKGKFPFTIISACGIQKYISLAGNSVNPQILKFKCSFLVVLESNLIDGCHIV